MRRQDDRELPDLSFAFYDHMIVFDNVQKTVIVVVLAKVHGREATREERAATAYDDACRRVDRFVEKLSTPTDSLDADRYRDGGRARADVSIELHAAAV